MPVTPPTIDSRDGAALARDLGSLRPFYAPEWTGGNGDPGGALAEVFLGLLEGLIRRLDAAPQKALVAFLDRVGTCLAPALPARVPLAFVLSRGAAQPVVVPERAQAAGDPAAGEPGDGGEPVVFETEKSFVATPAALVALFHAVPERDEIVDHLAALAAGSTAVLFDDPEGADLQEHALYLGHDELFQVAGPARFELVFEQLDPRLEQLGWQYHAAGQWRDFDDVSQAADPPRLVLIKDNDDALEPFAVGDDERRFLRAVVGPGGIGELTGLALAGAAAAVEPLADENGVGLAPETAFHNDVELDLGEPFLPFGSRPRLFDTFYLASSEAFSKRGAQVTLRVTPPASSPPADSDAAPSADLALSWEYWDGQGWRAIPDLTDDTGHLTATAEADVVFPCPDDIAPVEVLGEENFWIRVRIVRGDYGRETFSVGSGGQVIRELEFAAPEIESLSIGYQLAPAPLEALLTRNNLELREVTGAASFTPFAALEGPEQALYLGLDRPLAAGKGPFSFFFDLAGPEGAGDRRPRIRWEYLRRGPADAADVWAPLEVLDATRGLTESGTVELFGPPYPASASRFGRPGYWLRAADVDGRFRPHADPTSPSQEPDAPPPADTPEAEPWELVACESRDPRVAALRELPHPDFLAGAAATATPRLAGLFPNTTWAVQAETLTDEILGSGDATAGQLFVTSATPVIGEEIYVDELGALSEAARAELAADGALEIREERDAAGTPAAGTTTAFLVRWRPVDDLAEAGPDDRVYTIDHVFGEVRFGDGLHGRVPPVGRGNVRATYRAGGGARGNVAAGAVASLRSTIPLVDAASNPLAAAGGADTEELARALERGPQALRHRGRAVTRGDYEALAREASQAVARARCLPLTNAEGAEETNWVTLVVVPESHVARPFPSRELRRRVTAYVTARAAGVTVLPEHVRVIGPAYVEVAAAADLVPESADLAPAVELAARRRLDAYLHPLTGGADGRGWPFGRLPCRSDVFALLEAVAGLDHVENLELTLTPVTPDGAPSGPPTRVAADLPSELALPDYALVASGEHRLRSRLSGEPS